MKHLTLFLLLATSFCSYGQDVQIEPATPHPKRFQIGVNVSPDICYRTLKNTGDSSIFDQIIDNRNNNEGSRIGYTAGLNAVYKINDLISLEASVQFSSKGYQVNDIRITSFGNPNGTVNEAKLVYEYQYIDIPLKANFFLGKKKLRFIGSAGIAANIFIGEKTKLKYLNSDEPGGAVTIPKSEPKMLNLSPLVSAGIDYRINDWMNVRVEPTFRYGILKMYDAPIAQHLYSAGLNVGWYVGL